MALGLRLIKESPFKLGGSSHMTSSKPLGSVLIHAHIRRQHIRISHVIGFFLIRSLVRLRYKRSGIVTRSFESKYNVVNLCLVVKSGADVSPHFVSWSDFNLLDNRSIRSWGISLKLLVLRMSVAKLGKWVRSGNEVSLVAPRWSVEILSGKSMVLTSSKSLLLRYSDARDVKSLK